MQPSNPEDKASRSWWEGAATVAFSLLTLFGLLPPLDALTQICPLLQEPLILAVECCISCKHFLKKLLRQPLRTGYTRLEWRCSCGDHIFGDYSAPTKERLQPFEVLLQQSNPSSCSNLHGLQTGQHHLAVSAQGLITTTTATEGHEVQIDATPSTSIAYSQNSALSLTIDLKQNDQSTASKTSQDKAAPLATVLSERMTRYASVLNLNSWFRHAPAINNQDQLNVHTNSALDAEDDSLTYRCNWNSVRLNSPGPGTGSWCDHNSNLVAQEAFHFERAPLRLTAEYKHMRGKAHDELVKRESDGHIDSDWDFMYWNAASQSASYMSDRTYNLSGESSAKEPLGTRYSSNEPNSAYALGPATFLPNHTQGQGITPLQSTVISPDLVAPKQPRRFFELCVNIRPMKVALGELNLDGAGTTIHPGINTDAELFRLIHDRYIQIRRHRRFNVLYTPTNIQFVRFSVFAGGNVGIYESPMSLPSPSDVKNGNYHYFERPLDPLPPIDHRTFFHYFWNHQRHMNSQSRLFLDRLPKKLNTSMLAGGQPDQLNLGWGVHIIEGPNKKIISLCILCIVMVSFIVSLTYSLVIHSQESGFGIGQWIVAVGTVGLSAIYFHLSE